MEVVEVFGDDIHDGDVFMANDPYRGNTHIPDLVTAQPVFVDGKQVFWAVARGHQMDTGAIAGEHRAFGRYSISGRHCDSSDPTD